MLEFGEIFALPLTSTVYLSVSAALLLTLATVAVAMIIQPSRETAPLSWRRAA